MRYISLDCIAPDSILGKTLYTENGDVLLSKGTKLTHQYIEGILRHKFTGVYIDDGISEGIEVVEAVSAETRMRATQNLQRVFSVTENTTSKEVVESINALSNSATKIVDELLDSENILANLVEIKTYDDYTFSHSISVATISAIIGIGLHFKKSELVELTQSALLHDIGKIFIPNEIINKPGRLTDEEFLEVKNHPLNGYNYMKDKFYSSISNVALRGILDHHERFNGTGYPNNLAGDKISELGRIIAVADVYDALTSNRSYREAWANMTAVEHLHENKGTHFDPEMVLVFAKKVALFPVGSTVQLSNGCIALVVRNDIDTPRRPLVRIFNDGDQDVTPYEIDLNTSHPDLSITNMLML